MTHESIDAGRKTVEDTGWKRFPVHERCIAAGNAPVLQKLGRNYNRLQTLVREGTGADQTRARTALKAYGHAINLLARIRKINSQSADA